MSDEPTTKAAPAAPAPTPPPVSTAPAQVPAVLSPELNAAVQALAIAHADQLDDTEAQKALGKAADADVAAKKISAAEARALFSAYGVTKVAPPKDPDDKTPDASNPAAPPPEEDPPPKVDKRHAR